MRSTLMLLALLGVARGFCDETHSSPQLSASSSLAESPALGACNGNRWDSAQGHAWQGQPAAAEGWWWQIDFAQPRRVGSILQIHGQSGDVLVNAPREYLWQYSDDGHAWNALYESQVADERRSFRVHRLQRAVTARWFRLCIGSGTSSDAGPILREVEFYPDIDAPIEFPDWVLSVNITHRAGSKDGMGHLEVLRAATGENILAQHVDVSHVTPDFVTIEPRPLCMFLSGSYQDWCEVDRQVYRGVEQILTRRLLPIWGSCGGCQLLAILAETGTAQPWDCPHCRDPQSPKLPIYTHIHCAHASAASRKCGVYDQCEFERGPHVLQIVHADPVFAELPDTGQFTCQESHCGQVEYLPKGWTLLATHGPGGKTRHQLMKVDDHPIYAAQFHIDMGGEHARLLARNFLQVARQWQRQQVSERPVAAAESR